METFDIFSVFTMLGGLAFFLYGMNVMSSSLEKLTGGKLETALRKMTSSRIKSLLLGMGITIAIQSSSAVTVMLVGLVNSGIMQLEQTVAVCFGADIGTTLTAWILSLSGIKGDNFFLKLLKPSSFSPLVALAGVMLILLSKRSKKKDIGSIMLGFAILMTGMTLMSGAVEPLAERLLGLGAHAVLLKCGAAGIFRATSPFGKMAGLGEQFADPAWGDLRLFADSYRPDRIASGTGAGDTAIAAFLYSIMHHMKPAVCLENAAATGAMNLTEYDSLSGLLPIEALRRRIDGGWERQHLIRP